MEEIPCQTCRHLPNCHGQFEYTYDDDIIFGTTTAIELSCTGSGKKWFSGENKCKCWRYIPLDNLSWVEYVAKAKGLV